MVDIIAHRGLRSELPENTLPAISSALELPGMYGVEFDVEITGDGCPVVLHQETVVPNSQYTRIEPAARNYTSRDWVIETTGAMTLAMDAGSWMSETFSQHKIPSLKQVLDLSWGETIAFVELKDATYWGQRDLLRPAQVVAAAGPFLAAFQGSAQVISFNPEVLCELRRCLSHIPTTLALWTEWRFRSAEAMAEAKRCGASTVSMPDLLVIEDPRWICEAHDRGIKVHVYPITPARGEAEFLNWTARSQMEKWETLSERGVDALVTDFARETLQHFKGRR